MRLSAHLLGPPALSRQSYSKIAPNNLHPKTCQKCLSGCPRILFIPPKNQESPRQTKPKRGRFASRFANLGCFCEFGVFSLEKQGEFTEIGAIREFGFFFVNSPCSSRKSTPNSRKHPEFANQLANRPSVVWFAGATRSKKATNVVLVLSYNQNRGHSTGLTAKKYTPPP